VAWIGLKAKASVWWAAPHQEWHMEVGSQAKVGCERINFEVQASGRWEGAEGARSAVGGNQVVVGDQAVMSGYWHGWRHCGFGSVESQF